MIILNTRYHKLLGLSSILLILIYVYLFKQLVCSQNEHVKLSQQPLVTEKRHPCIDFWVEHAADEPLKVSDYLDDEPDEEVIIKTRNYNQCFIKLEKELSNLKCNIDLEAKVYPWLSRIVPNITTSDGKTSLLFDIDPTKCLLNQMKSKLKGRGIVLTATEFHFKELTHLIMLLRALNTKIPLQIVHRDDDFHIFNVEKLFELATVDVSEYPKYNEELNYYRERLAPNAMLAEFPVLDLSFVNVQNSLVKEYHDEFIKFDNKLLAYFFNSFEEVILMDVDAVPLIPMEDFFEFEEYKSKGAFFFKDRSLLDGHGNTKIDKVMLEILPKEPDFKFGIKPVTEFTYNKHFLKGFGHLMESGIVIVNRIKHFDNALMAITLDRFKKTIMEKIHGDKELYWLAMAVNGNEDYHFNEHFAASIGEISQGEHSHYPEAGDQVQEICSNHPAHIAKDNKTLLWINTGFAYCKKVMHMDETNPFFKGMTNTEIDKYNKGPLKIKAAIIPPVPRRPDVITVDNPMFPDHGWISRPYCEAYTLCAYDKIGRDTGIVVTFDQDQQHYFEYLAYIWMNSIDLMKEMTEKDNKKLKKEKPAIVEQQVQQVPPIN